MKETSKLLIYEVYLRVSSMVLACITALLLGFDEETKTIVVIRRKAHVKDLQALWIMTIVSFVAAGYQFLQLCKCLAFALLGENNICSNNKLWSWSCLIFDQGMTYVTYGASMAAAQGSMVAVTGIKPLQWQKLCSIYTRFCIQAGIAINIALLCSAVMILLTWLSAYTLFRLYSSSARSSRVVRWSMFWNVS